MSRPTSNNARRASDTGHAAFLPHLPPGDSPWLQGRRNGTSQSASEAIFSPAAPMKRNQDDVSARRSSCTDVPTRSALSTPLYSNREQGHGWIKRQTLQSYMPGLNGGRQTWTEPGIPDDGSNTGRRRCSPKLTVDVVELGAGSPGSRSPTRPLGSKSPLQGTSTRSLPSYSQLDDHSPTCKLSSSEKSGRVRFQSPNSVSCRSASSSPFRHRFSTDDGILSSSRLSPQAVSNELVSPQSSPSSNSSAICSRRRLASSDGATVMQELSSRDLKPRAPRIAAKNSDREVAQPVELQDKAKERLNMHKKKDEEQRQRAIAVINASINPGATDSGSDSKRTMAKKLDAEQMAISLVNGEGKSASQDQAKAMAKVSWDPERTPIPSSTDFVLIEEGNKKIFFPHLVQICKAFERMRPDKEGHVSYSVLLDEINSGNKRATSHNGSQMKHKLMNRSVGLCGPADKERQCRLVSNVFNFEDLLQFHFLNAKHSELLTMSQMVSPARMAFEKLTASEITESARLYNLMKKDSQGNVTYDSLETCLNDQYPMENVYLLLKNMDKEVLERLHAGGTIGIEEFALWYSHTMTSKGVFAKEKAAKKAASEGKLPGAVFSEYLNKGSLLKFVDC